MRLCTVITSGQKSIVNTCSSRTYNTVYCLAVVLFGSSPPPLQLRTLTPSYPLTKSSLSDAVRGLPKPVAGGRGVEPNKRRHRSIYGLLYTLYKLVHNVFSVVEPELQFFYVSGSNFWKFISFFKFIVKFEWKNVKWRKSNHNFISSSGSGTAINCCADFLTSNSSASQEDPVTTVPVPQHW